jgi:predicted nucleic acid-binding protein
MVNIYLDVNVLVDIIGERKCNFDVMIGNSDTTISVLSVHILSYLLKKKIPDEIFEKIVGRFKLVDLDNSMVKKALRGPTSDFEDNVQLYSAVAGECDYFLTLDKKLLKMKYFGKMRICDRL